MGYLNASPEDDARFDATARANPITSLQPDGYFSGFGSAIPRGLTSGALDVADTFSDLSDASHALAQPAVDAVRGALPDIMKPAFDSMTAYGTPRALWDSAKDIAPDMAKDISNSVEHFAKFDQQTMGGGAGIAYSLGKVVPIAAAGALAGPAGTVGMLGGVTGYQDVKEGLAAGLDMKTAIEKGVVTGLTNAMGAFLPIGAAGGLATKMAVGVAGNAGLGVASRFATSAILDANGYPEMAAQYKAGDIQSIMADAVLGMAFGGIAHLHGMAAHDVPPPLIDEAMAIANKEHADRSGVGIPKDPATANTHAEVSQRSIDDLVHGKEPSLKPEEAQRLTSDVVPDPEMLSLAKDVHQSLDDVHPGASDEGAPVSFLPEPVRAVETPDIGVPTETANSANLGNSPDMGNAPASTMRPAVQAMLDQIVARRPSMEVPLDDGRTITADQLPQHFSDSMAQAKKDSLLHDIAAGCFART